MTDAPEVPDTLAEALIRLQTALPRITKDETAEVETGTGRKYSYSYAKLSTITETAFPVLTELGLYWTCLPTLDVGGEKFVLRYELGHISGEVKTGDYPLPTGNPQTMGGAITYARRNAFCAVTGIAPAEDDDDASAMAEAAERRQQERSNAIVRERAASPPPHTRPAARSKGRQDDDPWATAPSAPEDVPGSINPQQLKRLHAAFGRLKPGLAREDKLAYAMAVLDLPELASSNDLSMRQAGELIARLESEATDG